MQDARARLQDAGENNYMVRLAPPRGTASLAPVMVRLAPPGKASLAQGIDGKPGTRDDASGTYQGYGKPGTGVTVYFIPPNFYPGG